MLFGAGPLGCKSSAPRLDSSGRLIGVDTTIYSPGDRVRLGYLRDGKAL